MMQQMPGFTNFTIANRYSYYVYGWMVILKIEPCKLYILNKLNLIANCDWIWENMHSSHTDPILLIQNLIGIPATQLDVKF